MYLWNHLSFAINVSYNYVCSFDDSLWLQSLFIWLILFFELLGNYFTLKKQQALQLARVVGQVHDEWLVKKREEEKLEESRAATNQARATHILFSVFLPKVFFANKPPQSWQSDRDKERRIKVHLLNTSFSENFISLATLNLSGCLQKIFFPFTNFRFWKMRTPGRILFTRMWRQLKKSNPKSRTGWMRWA